jgi:hypothetical protein
MKVSARLVNVMIWLQMNVDHSFAGQRQAMDRDGLLVQAGLQTQSSEASEPFPGAGAEHCRM